MNSDISCAWKYLRTFKEKRRMAQVFREFKNIYILFWLISDGENPSVAWLILLVAGAGIIQIKLRCLLVTATDRRHGARE